MSLMAISIWISDCCSLSPLPPHKALPKSILSTSIPYILSITSSSPLRQFVSSSSKSPSPLLHDIPTDQSVQLPSLPPIPPPPATDKYSNKFIQGLCKNPESEALAYSYYQKAREAPEFQPDRRTLDLLVPVLLRSKQWTSISALSKDFGVFRLLPNRSTCSRLIGGCIHARKFKLAESLLLVLGIKKGIAVTASGAAMRGYNKLHMYSSTVSVFDRMSSAGLSPNSACYFYAMDAHRKLGNTETVLPLFLEFESKGLVSSAFTARIYLVLCDSLGKSGRAFEALRYFREMVAKGIAAEPSFYTVLICAFAGIREAEIAEDLFQEALDKRMMRDPAVFLKLVLMYVDVGLVEKTMDLLEVMREMGIKVSDCTLSTIVNGFAKKRGLRDSVKAYEQLVSSGYKPGQVTYASMINVYCRLGLIPKAEDVFSEMNEKGFDRCVVAYSNMISMYGKAGRAKDAMRLLAKMKERGCQPNVWVYNSLLDMNGRLLNLKQVEKLWKEMKRRNVAPDRISYTSIICAYSKAKEFGECESYYQDFRMNGGKIDMAFAGIMVGVFSKSSNVDELLKLLQDLRSSGMELDGRLYNSAMNALRDSGLEVQVQWFKKSFGLQEDKT